MQGTFLLLLFGCTVGATLAVARRVLLRAVLLLATAGVRPYVLILISSTLYVVRRLPLAL